MLPRDKTRRRKITHRIADGMIAFRKPMALTAGLLLILLWPLSARLEFDRRIEQMFPADDPAVNAYELLREEFGGNAVAILVFRSADLFSSAGVDQVRSLSNQTSEIPGVLGVLSIAQVDDALSEADPQHLIGLSKQPSILQDSALANGFRDLFSGYTHDSANDLAAVVAMLDPSNPGVHESTIAQMRQLADALPEANQPVALVGEPVLVSEGYSMVDADGQRLATTTILLLAITTLLLFRTPRWVIAELAVILWAVIMTEAVSYILGLQLTMVSSMLTAIVTVIAVACVIHIAVRFGSRQGRGDDRWEATRTTLITLLPPIVWACATDAVGFAALSISNVGPVRDFGMMMTLGTGMVLVSVLLWMPFIMLIPARRFHTHLAPGDRWIRRVLVRLVYGLNRYRRLVCSIAVLLFLVTAVGLARLQTETNFIRNFRSSSELAQSYAMVESQFGGAGVWDIVLPAPSTITHSYFESVMELETELRNVQIPASKAGDPTLRLSKVLSMADADATAAKSRLLQFAGPMMRVAGMQAAMPAFADALLTPADNEDPDQQRYLRIMLRSPERTSAAAKMQLIEAVQNCVAEHTQTDAWQALFENRSETAGQVTGYYVLLARLIKSLLQDQWWCLFLASAAVLAMMAIAFRSLRMAAVCMIPNLLPILAVLGTLGLTGIRVNMGAAMIAAVSIGLTIDGSIHFLTGCQAARRRGASPLRAVLHAQRRVGLPVLLATLGLAIGFSVLASSTFIPTVTFGLLVTAALACGTAANLTLLPLLLVEFPPSPITVEGSLASRTIEP